MWGSVSWTIVSIWFLRITDAASVLETTSLIAAASVLGIAPGTWNFSTDPCVGGWTGVGCCRNNSRALCCAFPQIYPATPPLTPCERTADAQVSTLILRSDLFGNQLLNGTLPEALCNLTSLRILDVGFQRLRGQVPGCIGSRLSSLQILRMGENRFSGSIPEELGELRSLQQLFLDTTNISGPIPASLGRLSNLTSLSLWSNALEGDLPEEIGQLSNLVALSLQGNRLTGRIPDSYGNLANLRILRLFNNELSGGISSSVFQGMTSLTYVSLRHNRFSGPIPDFGVGFSLSTVDLGFNEFSGPLPGSLGGLSSLTSLFIDHNRLNGSIPDSFGSLPALAQLDISHNMLGGSLQSLGGNTQLMQLDVSFNFFNISSAPASVPQQPNLNAYFNCVPSGSSGTCSSSPPGGRPFFAVNAGGNALSSTTGSRVQVAFDSDANSNNQSVGFFYGSGPGLWALEVSGSEGGTLAFQGFINMTGAGGTEEGLYRSMRWSSSYIGYHGYSLRPGNYTVMLYFAELVFTEPGYRIFDVVLQGRVVWENLDIAREAGAQAAYVMSRNITINNSGSVSVELVYKGRDRFSLNLGPWAVRNPGPIVSAISVVSVDYRGEGGNSTSLSSGQIAGIALGSGAALLILVALLVYICKGKRAGVAASTTTNGPTNQQASLLDAGGIFTYQELHDATGGFNDKLGEGGFGAVYKGTLPNGTVIAVKQLVKHSQQVEEDFKREISIISKVRHRNLLAVIGYSLESDVPMLVCEFIPNGSLDKWLFRRRESALSWEARRAIAIGVSCGLAYLHDESNLRIIHCDVKPANILLDEDFNPRLADFGLARLYDERESHVTATRLKGTAGYLAPEYAMQLQLSDKVDVYSFGVVLLELLSGRRAVELSAPSEQIVLVDWAHKEAEIPANLLDIVDRKLQGGFVEQEARDMASIAILCTQRSPALRPKMQAVWLMLTGAVKVPEFLENLTAVIPSSSGGSTSQTLSSGNLSETSIAAFRSLRVFGRVASPESFSSSKAVTQ
ncbi:probable LRR receptor-like serine/threonine-protein kinase At1g56130 isoform X3 [Selaginella moellendorffii]|uniref:probable LRR receptor-like serine/threonine-protein kinase At1g56130 isoform X3 n=1 Tax=Selaginella moellendorffii TaxID=88036 RepID=UPI000D1CA173|nr:probable LRR receptor-like serine/threonine-protein kinase At1g56130 isoform X3 [Selaginella moellendorffii]|eukprot:XP_024517010.1 probable LRR receptor-like serine/threonine-protein kinase At1g56130 isoform X3 [Selaginella moellendorffii]